MIEHKTVRRGPRGHLRSMLLIGLLLILFGPTVVKLMGIWGSNDDYSHGFFVVPICIYMLWQKKAYLTGIKRRVCWWGLPLLVIGLSIHVLSFVTRLHTLTNLSMILVIASVVMFLMGWDFTKGVIAPLLFLLFMLPIPSAYYIMLTNPLKLMITRMSGDLIELMGVPVFRDGNLLFFSNSQLEVAEACSGVRSLYSYLMLGCVFAAMSRSAINKAVMIFLAIPLAFVVNVVRVTVTGVLTEYYGPGIAQGFFHEFSGMILFIIGLAGLFLAYSFLGGSRSIDKSI